MWHLVSVVVSWSLSRGLSGKLGKPLTIRLCSFTLQGVSSLLPHDATSSHWGSRRSHSASLCTSKNSASAEWSCINLRYSRERHQHTGCVHRLWVWLFIVVSCFSCLSISCLWIATHSSQIQLMITFIQTQLLQGPFWYENPMTRRHGLWNRRYGRYWNPGDKHFIWSCTFPCLLFLGSCHLPVLCSDTAQ